MSGQSHRSDPRVLNRRTLERDHRTLANLLQPAMIVLDVGCGTGAITAGIAKVVGPAGRALGIDRDGAQVAQARQEHAGVPNLSFEEGDALSMTFEGRFDIVTAARTLQWLSRPSMTFEGRFDIVTAARTLQWLSRPGEAVARMTKAAKPGGRVVVLDYNHESNSWDPDPPEAFRRFYRAFLEWRKENQWDNRMADRLPDLFRAAGIAGVQVHL